MKSMKRTKDMKNGKRQSTTDRADEDSGSERTVLAPAIYEGFDLARRDRSSPGTIRSDPFPSVQSVVDCLWFSFMSFVPFMLFMFPALHRGFSSRPARSATSPACRRTP